VTALQLYKKGQRWSIFVEGAVFTRILRCFFQKKIVSLLSLVIITTVTKVKGTTSIPYKNTPFILLEALS
jgi:hypothetical protein